MVPPLYRLQEGVDSKDLGITKGRSTPADWAAQGYNLLDKGLFEAAGRCFERAGDVSRQQVGAGQLGGTWACSATKKADPSHGAVGHQDARRRRRCTHQSATACAH